MLPRQQRVRAQRDYDRIFRGRRQARGRYLVLRGLPNTVTTSRFGFVVSKTVAKKANIRNVLKRRLREIARPLVLVSPHWDISTNVQPAAVKTSFAELQKEFLSLHHQLLHETPRHFSHHPLPKNPVARPRSRPR